jgi:hypothetical protein
MSTLKSINLQHPSAASPNIVLDSSGNATMAGSMAMTTPFAMKNKIINGAMQINQRNEGTSVNNTAAAALYTLDRWWVYGTAATKFSVQRNAGSVTPPAGFAYYMGITSSAATTPGLTDIYVFSQKVEGYNFADAAFGTASAKSITLSFWVRSSLTGTFGGSLLNSAANRVYVFSYSISAANTWEYKTITVSGDTTGTWLTDNGVGLSIYWDLGSGASQKGTAGSWGTTVYYGPTGGTNVIGTNGATFYITGVQLEIGTTATPFERRLYGQELALCQRYYTKTYNTTQPPANAASGGLLITLCGSGGVGFVNWAFPVEMRASPTVTPYNATTGASGTWRDGGGVDRTALVAGEGTRQAYIYTTTATANSSISGQAVAAIEL